MLKTIKSKISVHMLIPAVIIIIFLMIIFEIPQHIRYLIDSANGERYSILIDSIFFGYKDDYDIYFLNPDVEDNVVFDSQTQVYKIILPKPIIDNNGSLDIHINAQTWNNLGGVTILKDDSVISKSTLIENTGYAGYFWSQTYAAKHYQIPFGSKEIELNRIYTFKIIIGKELENLKLKFVTS